MSGSGPNTVEVHFIDLQTGKSFATSHVPLPNLPKTFAPAGNVQTTLQIQGSDWIVMRADPVTSEEFAKTKRLTLWLKAVTKVDPQNILFSLPTICDVIPGIVPASPPGTGDILRLHEDDWRQIEFVALALENQIDECLTQIRRIHTQERAGAGFRKCHIRKEPREPLAGTAIRVGTFPSRLRQDLRSYTALSYQGVTGVIEGGFALETGSLLTLYGQQQESLMTSLCLLPHKGAEADVEDLLDITRGNELCLVDWCRAQKVMPEPEEFRRYFAKPSPS